MLKVDQYDLIRTSYRVYGKQISTHSGGISARHNYLKWQANSITI